MFFLFVSRFGREAILKAMSVLCIFHNSISSISIVLEQIPSNMVAERFEFFKISTCILFFFTWYSISNRSSELKCMKISQLIEGSSRNKASYEKERYFSSFNRFISYFTQISAGTITGEFWNRSVKLDSYTNLIINVGFINQLGTEKIHNS